jgi:hypothetical protein
MSVGGHYMQHPRAWRGKRGSKINSGHYKKKSTGHAGKRKRREKVCDISVTWLWETVIPRF